MTYHFYGGALDQYCFCEGGVIWLNHIDPFPLQDLHNSVVIQTVIVGVRIDVGQRQAVEFGTGQGLSDLRLESVLIIMVLIERFP